MATDFRGRDGDPDTVTLRIFMSASPRRVVISGLGPVTPAGVGIDALWELACNGGHARSRAGDRCDTGHLGAEVGQNHRRVGADARDVDDFQSLQRVGHACLLACDRNELGSNGGSVSAA